MANLTNAPGQYPKALQGVITIGSGMGTAAVRGDWVYVGTWATATFKAKVVKYVAGSTKITVKNMSGTLASADALKTRLSDGSADRASATGTVDTITNATAGGIEYSTGGLNVRIAKHGITRSKAAGSRTLVEVLFANAGLAARRTDFATLPTFTLTGGAWSAATTYDVSAGDAITFTIISSEAVAMSGTVTYPFAITGVGAKTATYVGSSADGLSHMFAYPVVTDDIGGTAFTITTGNLDHTAGRVLDKFGPSVYDNDGVIAVAGSLASKTGVTIQA